MFKNYGDITKIDGSKIEPVDCVIGGSPCQSFSQAGTMSGFEGVSGLFLHQIRLIKEMLEKTNYQYPHYMVLENVTGLLSCHNGADFQRVLMECINVATKQTTIPNVPMPKDGKWPKSGILYDDMGGWSIAWRVHDAQYWGVAQRRRRIALVVDFRGLTAPKVLFEPKSVQRNFNTCNTQREGTTEGINGSPTESDKESCIYDARGNGTGKLASALTGDHDNRITDYTNVVVENKELKRKVNNKLPTICIGNGQAHVTEHYTEEVAQTLNCMHDPMTILEPVVLNCQGNKSGCGTIHDGTCFTLNAMPCFDVHCITEYKSLYRVRRLTPLECTRLQGFPDHYVDIGDWVDSKNKKHKETDAPKYKALGNSIALPFWKWLCKNIVNALKEENKENCVNYIPTMGSLFAGIGGFDLCWTEATGNKDSILWVSEIEEFPIAVMKHHFSNN
jgi:DNA (cytosine-5)-methyltransferase 1